MKQLSYLILTWCSINLILGSSLRTNRNISEADYNDWLSNLESQIITNSGELPLINNNVPVDPEPVVLNRSSSVPKYVDYDNAEEVNEPIFVTSKAYLTGEKSSLAETTTETTNTTTLDSEYEKPEKTNITSIIGDKYLTTERVFTHKTYPAMTPSSHFRHNNASESDDIETLERVRTLLDKLLATPSPRFHNPRPNPIPDGNDGSEVNAFVVVMRNRTQNIILGCLVSSVFLVALIVSVWQIVKKLNERNAITLIAHNEYGDVSGVTGHTGVLSQKSSN